MNKIIAHRGIHNDKIKENTYLAISEALNNNKLVGVEFDIRLTKDKYIVIIHDSYINRTSNGSGKVENMMLKELEKYNYGTKFFYQSIITLDKILELNTNKILLIEVKVDNNELEFAKVLKKEITKYNNKNIYITSFSKKFLKYFYKTKNIKIGPIIFNNNIKNNRYDFYVLNYLTFKKNSISRLKKRNKDIFIWSLLDDYVNDIDDVYLIKNIS